MERGGAARHWVGLVARGDIGWGWWRGVTLGGVVGEGRHRVGWREAKQGGVGYMFYAEHFVHFFPPLDPFLKVPNLEHQVPN